MYRKLYTGWDWWGRWWVYLSFTLCNELKCCLRSLAHKKLGGDFALHLRDFCAEEDAESSPQQSDANREPFAYPGFGDWSIQAPACPKLLLGHLLDSDLHTTHSSAPGKMPCNRWTGRTPQCIGYPREPLYLLHPWVTLGNPSVTPPPRTHRHAQPFCLSARDNPDARRKETIRNA